MSYSMLSGMGGGCCGFGAVASDFNGTGVWADCLAGSAGNNAAGKRCGQAIQDGLNRLGYGPLTVDGQIGAKSIAAIKAFSSANGLGTLTWPTKAMVLKMQELLASGATPGPATPTESHIVDGEYVPGAGPGGTAQAGMSTGLMIGIGAVALLGLGAIAVFAKKKGGKSTASTSMARV